MPIPSGSPFASFQTDSLGNVTVSSPVSTSSSLTPTVSTTAYVAGYVVGGLLTFANAFRVSSGIVQNISISVKSTQTATFKLYLFSSMPSTFTDHATPAISTADASKVIGVYTLSTSDSGLGSNSTIYNLESISKQVTSSGTSLYAVLVTTGTPTFSTTSDLVVTVGVLSD